MNIIKLPDVVTKTSLSYESLKTWFFTMDNRIHFTLEKVQNINILKFYVSQSVNCLLWTAY